MNTKHVVKVIKKRKRNVPELMPKIESAVGPARWSTAVQSWVSEFQKQRREDSLAVFDSLFK